MTTPRLECTVVEADLQRRGSRCGTGLGDQRPHQAGRGPGPGVGVHCWRHSCRNGRFMTVIVDLPPRIAVPPDGGTCGHAVLRAGRKDSVTVFRRSLQLLASVTLRSVLAQVNWAGVPSRRPQSRAYVSPGPAPAHGPAYPPRRSGPLSVSSPAWAVAMFAAAGAATCGRASSADGYPGGQRPDVGRG